MFDQMLIELLKGFFKIMVIMAVCIYAIYLIVRFVINHVSIH